MLLKIVTGTYILQTIRHSFNQNQVDPLCLLCKGANETIAYFLLDCTTLEITRQRILKDIKHILRNCGLDLNNSETLLRLLIDCSAVIDSKTVSEVMRGSRNFRQGGGGGGGGGPGQSDKKSSDKSMFFFIPQFILQKSNGLISKKTIIFQGSRGVVTFSRGGGGWSNFFQVGSNCLFPIEINIACDFPGGGVGGGQDPCPPLWIRT